ncbi:hypothetical protein FA13DRAFT_1179229 [Coprinellus micaceus]|uniref:Uncharacterized protein n=1 Tax=Coprinellus micaceus TaxID=71717 RepID=A0A4Y7STY2_COPMI|nr:hypothetical protein FA13DRAFT_1179229 [Coprinellus micaceus]
MRALTLTPTSKGMVTTSGSPFTLHATIGPQKWSTSCWIKVQIQTLSHPNQVTLWTGGYYAFPLAWAAAKGGVDLVNRLLTCGADPNLKGGWDGSALHACAWEGKVEVARILLERGVDPNIQSRFLLLLQSLG